jgi:hypothetical protein
MGPDDDNAALQAARVKLGEIRSCLDALGTRADAETVARGTERAASAAREAVLAGDNTALGTRCEALEFRITGLEAQLRFAQAEARRATLFPEP